jgi:O-antigen biosynthesis protein
VESDPQRSRHLAELAHRVGYQELMAAHLADTVITHSTAEAEILRSLPAVIRKDKVHVVPWAVPVQAVQTPFGDRSGVAFIGNFRHEPNIDAARWLVNEVMPLVWREAPHIKCLLVGGDMPESVRLDVEGPRVDVLGHVDNLTDVFERVRLTVAPLRFGAGIKDKVIRSLAAGLPCVGTAEAFAGMAKLPAALIRDCIHDSASGLAATIVRLEQDPIANKRCGEAGLSYAGAVYNESRIDALIKQLVQPALGRRRAKLSRFRKSAGGADRQGQVGHLVTTLAFEENVRASDLEGPKRPGAMHRSRRRRVPTASPDRPRVITFGD